LQENYRAKLEPVRRAGYVTIVKSGRNRLIHLTLTGQAILDDAYPRWDSVQRKAIESLGGEDDWLRLKREFAIAARI